MEAVTWSEVSYRDPPLPRLRTARNDIPRRDSLSSSITGDSGYISDTDFSLSPLDMVSPHQVPWTSSDFSYDSSALLDVKEASARTKRLATSAIDPIAKKHKFTTQGSFPTPRIEVTSNPALLEDRLHPVQEVCSPGPHTLKDVSHDGIESWATDKLHPRDCSKQRNLSTVSLDSTGSCDMYSNTDDNSDDEHGSIAVPHHLSKATLKTIDLIMRKIEVNLNYATYVQCAGSHAARTQGKPNSSRGSRSSQVSNGKRKGRSDESLPPDDPDEDDANKRRRVSVTTTTEDSDTGPRFACPFFKHDPNRYRHRRTCGGPGWPTVHRMKEHLYRSHAQPIFCPRCYVMFDSDADFSAHIRGDPCPTSDPQTIEGIDRKTFESLKKRCSNMRLEEDKWRDSYQLLFPDVAPADIPSPYYDSDSPTEESRRFRRELLERVRTELFATAEREPGPVEQRLLRQVANIIRRCEAELLESFYAPSDRQLSSSSSRRGSAPGIAPIDTPPRSQQQPAPPEHPVMHPERPPPDDSIDLPDTLPFRIPVNQRPELTVWDLLPYGPLYWDVPFPPAPEIQQADHEDNFMAMDSTIWTR